MSKGTKLSAEQVAEMRRQHYELGLCVKCVSKLHRVNYFTTHSAIRGHTWGPISDWYKTEERAAPPAGAP